MSSFQKKPKHVSLHVSLELCESNLFTLMIPREEKLDFNSPHFDPLLALSEPNYETPVKVFPLNHLAQCRTLLPPTDPNYIAPNPVKPQHEPEQKVISPSVSPLLDTTPKELALSSPVQHAVNTNAQNTNATQRRDILELIAGME